MEGNDESDYDTDRHSFPEMFPDIETSAEHKLWQAVLVQSFKDTMILVESEDNEDAWSARTWFNKKPPDYYLVCELAGFEHEFITLTYNTLKVETDGYLKELFGVFNE